MKLPGHSRYGYTPLRGRPDFTWPGGKRLAVYISVAEEYFAFGRPAGQLIAEANAQPDQRAYSWRDYGNRIGFWRIMDILDELGAPAVHQMNSTIIEYHPQIAEAALARGDEILAHGRTNSERQGQMWEEDERRLIEESRDVIAQFSGRAPQGYVGPGLSESLLTVDLLADAGFGYTLGWPFDDQPTWMKTRSGKPLLSIPYGFDLQDGIQVLQHHHTGDEYADMVIAGFDEMLLQSAKHAIVYPISIHPMTVGQAHRLGALRRALTHIYAHPRRDEIWFARPGEILDYCRTLPAGTLPE